MNFPPNVWNQVKNVTAQRLVQALEKDDWVRDAENPRGAVLVYRHSSGRRITVHWHPNKTYGPKLLKGLLEDIGWDEADLRRLKLIK